MKWYKLVALQMLPIVCIITAGFLAYKGIDGWGWFLFIAACLSYYYEEN